MKDRGIDWATAVGMALAGGLLLGLAHAFIG